MNPKPPTVVMLVGLQGSGKTTTSAKVARHFERDGRHVLLVAADTTRPAAVEQLRVLASRIDVPVLMLDGPATEVASGARKEAARLGKNVVVVDTAGRQQIDEVLMSELGEMRDTLVPDYSVLVVDAMTGQEAVNIASAFDAQIGIDGVILTKADGDARGGAALSVKEVTGKPILFVGTGEKVDDLESFHPDRIASRILGMGDVLTLIEKADEAIEAEEAKNAEQRLRAGKFTLADFRDQMRQVRKLGSLRNVIGMLPGIPGELRDTEIDEGQLGRIEAIINSMTPYERDNPEKINGSRRARVARGSGTTTADVNALLDQFKVVQRLIKQMAGGRGRRGKGFRLAGR